MALPKKRSYAPPTKIKKYSKIVLMLITLGKILLYQMIFSLFSLVFLIDKIPNLVKLFAGLLFEAPIFYMILNMGRQQGEIDYKLSIPKLTANIHDQKLTKYNPWISLIYPIFYVVLLLVMCIVAMAINNITLRGIIFIVIMPIVLFFMGFNIIDFKVVDWLTLVMVIISIILVYTAYLIGYFRQVKQLKKQQSDIATERRLFGE